MVPSCIKRKELAHPPPGLTVRCDATVGLLGLLQAGLREAGGGRGATAHNHPWISASPR